MLHSAWTLAVNHELVLSLAALAVINTMPDSNRPLTWRTLYEWFYDALHLFVSLRNPRPISPASEPEPHHQNEPPA